MTACSQLSSQLREVSRRQLGDLLLDLRRMVVALDEETGARGAEHLMFAIGNLEAELEAQDQRVTSLILHHPLLPGLVASSRLGLRMCQGPCGLIQPRACRQSLHGQHGIDAVFGLPGDGINGVMESLRTHRDRIRFVHVRHEETAALAACAYGKFTGRPAACLSTAAPGAVHLMNGLYDARIDQSPVIAITGMTYHDVIGTHYLQDINHDVALLMGSADEAAARVRTSGPSLPVLVFVRARVVLVVLVAGIGVGANAGHVAVGNASVHVRSGAVALAASNGALWVSGFGAVSRLDPATGRVVAVIKTAGTGDYSSIAVGDASVWVTAAERGGTVYRIDPSTNRVVATIRVGGSVQGIAVAPARIWVTRPLQGPGDVIRIDPHTNRVAGAPITVGPGPTQVVYGQHALWVQDTSPASVMRVDPATGRVATVVGTRPVPRGSFVVGAIAIGYGSLWTAANDSLTRIDPRTGQVQAGVHIPRAQEIAIGAGEVWVLAAPRSSSPTLFYPIKHTAALWEVSPGSNRIIAKPVRLASQQPVAVTASHENVWVADYSSATVTRFRLDHRACGARSEPRGRG
jgi:streptogramin lyase